MSKRRRNEALRRKDADEAHQLQAQGWTYTRIGKKQGLSKAQIGKDLAWRNGSGWLSEKREVERCELCKRAKALRVERDLTQKEIGDELAVSRSEARRLLKEAKAPPRTMNGTQKYPTPPPKMCAYPRCEKPARVRWPSSVVYGRGVYCGEKHRVAACADQLRERKAAINEQVARLKVERDLLETSEVVQMLGVTSTVVTDYYVSRGLTPERHVLEGETVLLFPRTAVEAFRHAWVAGGLKVHRGRRSRWFDPEYVVRAWKAHHWLNRLAERKGLSEEEAETLVRARVKRRRGEMLPHAAGRPRSTGPPPHHHEWAAAFVRLEADQWERYDAYHVDGDPPPTKLGVALAVAIDDHAHTPERWAYDPNEYAANAARTVWKAVKPLLTPVTEIRAA